MTSPVEIALVTGASRGFGLALTTALAARGTTVVACARDGARLRAAVAGQATTRPVAADVTDPDGRAAVIAAARRAALVSSARRAALVSSAQQAAAGTTGPRLDLLVHNAGDLGPSPLPPLERYPAPALRAVLESNVLAPLELTQLALPLLRASAAPTVVTLSSDAAVEAYPGWGGYGAAKAALDQLAAVLAVELGEPFRVYAFDPGDMRTDMHQRAFPGEDISDRPEPASVVPALSRLLDERPPSGRYRAADLAAAVEVAP